MAAEHDDAIYDASEEYQQAVAKIGTAIALLTVQRAEGGRNNG